MSPNPEVYKKFEVLRHYEDFIVSLLYIKRDIRNGFNLGRKKEVKKRNNCFK